MAIGEAMMSIYDYVLQPCKNDEKMVRKPIVTMKSQTSHPFGNVLHALLLYFGRIKAGNEIFDLAGG